MLSSVVYMISLSLFFTCHINTMVPIEGSTCQSSLCSFLSLSMYESLISVFSFAFFWCVCFLSTGLLKILKKHDKRTGVLIRFPFVQRVMQQPFFSTEVLDKLVKECEGMLDHVFSRNDPSGPSEAAKAEEQCDSEPVTETREIVLKAPIELAEIKQLESVYGKQTETALRVLKDIRSGSSTVSAFSLPPLQINVVEEDSKNIHVLQQEAK